MASCEKNKQYYYDITENLILTYREYMAVRRCIRVLDVTSDNFEDFFERVLAINDKRAEEEFTNVRTKLKEKFPKRFGQR